MSSSGSSPSVQPPVYLWGPSWVVSKPRVRLSLVRMQVNKRVCVCDQVCAYKTTDLYFSNPSSIFLTSFQVLTADQQRAFCRIGAIIRGFLTRRLLKTEKVKHLRQTIVVRLHSHKNTHKKNVYERVACWEMCVYMFV